MDDKKRISESDVHAALACIVMNADVKALNYAVNYARIGMILTGHDLEVQVLYVLNNISYWRGDDAKSVRKVLKAFVKGV